MLGDFKVLYNGQELITEQVDMSYDMNETVKVELKAFAKDPIPFPTIKEDMTATTVTDGTIKSSLTFKELKDSYDKLFEPNPWQKHYLGIDWGISTERKKMTFKEGDKVKFNGTGTFENGIDENAILKITYVDFNDGYPYMCSDDQGGQEKFREDQLTLIEKGNKSMSLQKVPTKLAKFIDANYKALYQLNYVDKDLELTDTGKKELISFLLDQNIDAFGKAAQAKVAEIEAEDAKETN